MTDEVLETSATPAVAEAQDNAPETNAAQTEAPTHQHDHDHAGHSHGPTLNPELRREIFVEAPADAVSKTYAKIVKRYQKQARLPGFRPGKVPEITVRNRFARELRQEVMEALVNDRFRAAVEEQNLQPISQPQVTELNLFDGQPLRFRAEFEVAPQIDVTGYEDVRVEKPTTTLDDAEYKAELDRMLESYATIETVEEDRELQDGDWAEIQFTGKRRETDGGTPDPSIAERTEDVQGEDVLVEIGGANTLPAFNEALRGKKVGQEFEIEVEYPKDFGDLRLAGQTVNYEVKVSAIKKKVLPERDAEFAKQLGEFDSFEAFEADLRDRATKRKQSGADQEAKSKLVDAIVERFNFPVPESFVQQQIDVRLDRGLRALAQQGMTEDQMRQLDFVRLRDAQRDEAVKEVKASLLLDTIAAKENIEVKEEDLQRELMMMSIQSRQPYEQLRERMQQDGSIQRMREQMRREATATVLYDKIA
ncbi:trigger factor [Terriglobus aquaticus]|uniref:Trigger factor n=1 Tax=Terriglobus aquaticus TaxID=940139 RepID=A0ABW9KL28_9BACT|nr:trigger factor [Terriglobus aquaticus]